MRRFRVWWVLWLLVGLAGGFSQGLRAETISATSTPGTAPVIWGATVGNPPYTGATTYDVCGAKLAGAVADAPSWTGTQSFAYCRDGTTHSIVWQLYASCPSGYTHGGTSVATETCTGGSNVYSCPSGQGWTLSGQSCTRPDCAAGSARQSDGSCLQNCNVAENEQVGTGYVYERPANGSKACVDGCEVYVSGRTYTEGSKKWGQAFSYGTPCLPSESSPADPVNDLDKSCMSKGMCGGTVNGQAVCTACDQTSQTTKEVKVETPPSGPPVTTTTTTTEVCTQAGSCTTTTNTTSSAGGGSTTTTKAPGGTPGDGSGQDPTDKKTFCEENPTLSICQQTSYSASTCSAPPACTGDAVQCAQALEVWKTRCDLLDAMTPKNTDDSPISGADATPASKTAYDAAFKKMDDAAGGVTADPAAASQSAWSAAMSSGWFDSITIAGCTATDYSLGGRVFHFDPCPVAAKISEIGSYALWITLVIGGFVFVTGGRAAGVK